MAELEKVTAQRDLLLYAINREIAKINSQTSMFEIAYVCANLEQASATVTKDMQS